MASLSRTLPADLAGRRVLPVDLAAAYLGVSPRTMREWRFLSRDGELVGPAWVVVGGRIGYRVNELDRWLDAQAAAAGVPQPPQRRKRNART